MLTRRAVVGGLLGCAGQPLLAGAPERSLRPIARARAVSVAALPDVQSLIAKAKLGGAMSFVVADARSGQVLEAHNPLLAMPPASVAKTLTAQYALQVLGPAHVFETRLIATGPIVNGRIEGDLALVGGGDPTLDSTALAEMAASLKAAGVREVAGRFIVSTGALPQIPRIDRQQPEHLSYNPAVSGLNLNYNRVYFQWKRAGGAWHVTLDARTAKYRPQVELARMKIVDRKYPIYTFSSSQTLENWTVAKAALGTGGTRWLPVRHPDLYAGEVFRTFARAQGIQLANPQPRHEIMSGAVLVSRASAPLETVLRDMLKRSVNLTAEVAGLSATLARGLDPAGLGASAREMSGWLKQEMGLQKPRLVDHSGLSDRSRISARDMVTALLRTGPESELGQLLKTVKMRDSIGNLAENSGMSLKAKTGTLNFVSGLAGYLTTRDNRTLAFAMFSADTKRRAAIPVQDRERPPGARSWNGRAHRLQWALLNRWAVMDA